MNDKDPELRHLQRRERDALERYQRLSKPNGFPAVEVLQAAEYLWREAAAAVCAYRERRDAGRS